MGVIKFHHFISKESSNLRFKFCIHVPLVVLQGSVKGFYIINYKYPVLGVISSQFQSCYKKNLRCAQFEGKSQNPFTNDATIIQRACFDEEVLYRVALKKEKNS